MITIERKEKFDPIEILRRIQQRDCPKETKLLDLFAGEGIYYGRKLAPMVAYYEAWDIDQEKLDRFRAAAPEIVTRRLDTYETIKKLDRQFHWILYDSWVITGENTEHYNLFPGILAWLSRPVGYLSLSLIVDPEGYFQRAEKKQTVEESLKMIQAARKKFYGVLPTTEEEMIEMHVEILEARWNVQCSWVLLGPKPAKEVRWGTFELWQKE